jgi:hypothetical protein
MFMVFIKCTWLFPRRCVSAGIFVLNYGATNVTFTQKDRPFLSSKRRPHFQTYKWPWNEQKFGHGSRNQERLCWRGYQQFTAMLCYAFGCPVTEVSSV